MKAGVFTVILGSLPFEKALDYAASLGFEAVEIGAGGWAGTAHCDPDALLASDRKTKDFLNAVTSRGLQISSLNVAGNPIHPNRKVARAHDADFRRGVRLARKLGVEIVTTFSGCPGGAPSGGPFGTSTPKTPRCSPGTQPSTACSIPSIMPTS